MAKSNTSHRWVETGYGLFAKEGPEGIQVERLARIIGLNKSGFYHYFGDGDSFTEQLLKRHNTIAEEIIADLKNASQLDPDLFTILLSYKPAILFHMQLVRNRHIEVYLHCYYSLNALLDPYIIRLFSEYVGLQNNQQLASSYFDQARDMFYARVTDKNMNEKFLRSLLKEVKHLAQEFLGQQSAFDRN